MRPNKLKNIAKERGVSVADLLIQAYEVHGSQQLVAREFNISQARISQILKEHKLVEKAVLVESE
jgi:hypothetical protein